MSTLDGRVRHYGTFYGVKPETAAPDAAAADSAAPGPPLLVVYGNCQAESIRVLLGGSESLDMQTVRVPPVFELTSDDLPFLRRLLARTQVLISQPVHDDYHEMPLGAAQLAAMMPAGGRVLRWPVLRYAGFHPFQTIIRDPRDPGRDPPVVPYHDLRTVASARQGVDLAAFAGSVTACDEVAAASRAELHRREEKDCDITISDVFDDPAAGDMATINHPGNRVLIELARRIQLALDRPADAADPGRRLLGEVVAPAEPSALAALGLPTDGGNGSDWLVGGQVVTAASIHDAQLLWYLENPWIVDAGYLRHRETLETLGLA